MSRLNVFMPYRPVEQRSSDDSDERERRRICDLENNLTRALFIVLEALSERGRLPELLAALGEGLARNPRSRGGVQSNPKRVLERLSAVARDGGGSTPNGVYLQGLPPATSVSDHPVASRLLISVSGTGTAWVPFTRDHRVRPLRPQPDAWVTLGGRALLAFEMKTDAVPPDATQLLGYASTLGLLDDRPELGALWDGVPRHGTLAEEGSEAARAGLSEVVLDLTWGDVRRALRDLRLSPDEHVASYLLRQLDDYLDSQAIVERVSGPIFLRHLGTVDGPARSREAGDLVRTLLDRLGEDLRTQHRQNGSWKAGPSRPDPSAPERGVILPIAVPAGPQGFSFQIWTNLGGAHPDGQGTRIGLSAYAQSSAADMLAARGSYRTISPPGAGAEPQPADFEADYVVRWNSMAGEFGDASGKRATFRSSLRRIARKLSVGPASDAFRLELVPVGFYGDLPRWQGKSVEFPDHTAVVEAGDHERWGADMPWPDSGHAFWRADPVEPGVRADWAGRIRTVRKPAVSVQLRPVLAGALMDIGDSEEFVRRVTSYVDALVNAVA